MTQFDVLIGALLLDREFSVRLTVALLHLLWQGTLIAVIAAIGTRMARGSSARLRCGINLAALAAIAVCLPFNFVTMQSRHTRDLDPEYKGGAVVSRSFTTTEVPPESESAPASATKVNPAFAPANDESFAVSLPMAAPYVVAIYGVGICAMLLRLASGLWAGRRLRVNASVITDRGVLALIAEQADRVGLKIRPAAAWCERAAVPTVVGIVRPLVLLPVSLTTGLNAHELAALVSHELAHIRRWDPLVNLCQRLIEAVLFFHPAVWYLSRRVSSERELCCDDLTIQSGIERTDYAGALIRMAELYIAGSRPAVLAEMATLRASGKSGRELRARIYRLLGENDSPKAVNLRWVAVLGAMVTLAVTAAIAAPRRAVEKEPDKNQSQDDAAVSDTDKSSASVSDDSSDADDSDSVYQLRDGEVFKWIPPALTDKRPKSPALNSSGQYYEQDGNKVRLRTEVPGGEPLSLYHVVFNLLRVYPCEMTGDSSVWMMPIAGDFLIRKDASRDELLKAFDDAVRNEMKLEATLRWKEVTTDAWVVRGAFKPAPIGEAWRRPKDKNRAYVFYGRTGPGEGQHGVFNVGSFDEMLNELGSRTGLPVVNAIGVSPAGRFGWQTYYDHPERTVWTDFPRQFAKNVDLVVKHFEQQTGLDIRKERRKVTLLRASADPPDPGEPLKVRPIQSDLVR